MSRLKELFEKYREIIMYLIFGVATTIVSWGTYAVFVRFAGLSVTVGNILSWFCAVTFAYITNKLWVFDSKSWEPGLVIKEIISFFGTRLLTGVIEMVGVPALVGMGLSQTIFGIDGMLSKVLVSVIVVILNYIFSKVLIFRDKNSHSD